MRRSDISGPVALLVIGSVFRLVWPADMEWKGDEQSNFARAIAAAHDHVFPWLGTPSSADILNPGFSIWPFALVARFSPDPVAMVGWVQWSNVIALWAFFWLFARAIPGEERGVWLWGLALFAVSPFGVMFSRKLWIPEILPLFCVAVLWGHFYRRTRIGAFTWGLGGALIGQVHLSGFFLAFALVWGTVVRDAQRGELRATRWMYWIVGSLIGGVVLLPWLSAFVTGHAGHSTYHLREVVTLNFYAQWFLAAWGLLLASPRYAGIEFLREPLLWGHPTYLMLLAHIFLASVSLWITLRWFAAGLRPRFDDRLTFYLLVTLIVVGPLLTLSGVRVRAFYLIIVAPFIHLWAAAMIWPRKRLLASVAAAEMLVTATFLAFVHREGGVPWTEYGSSYRAQHAGRTLSPGPPATE
ncbi:MAG TPA: hypothetical protein VGO33_06935 [Gemmatimonadaceae bacterium]|nr:hypothetical protein [Gemmatimonadaceae bacterium]